MGECGGVLRAAPSEVKLLGLLVRRGGLYQT